MALEKEGVILTAEGANQFINHVDRARDSLGKFIKTTDKAGSSAKASGGGLGSLASMGGKLKGSLGGLGSLGGVASGAMAAVGVAAAASAAVVAGLVVGIGLLGKAMAKLAQETAPVQGIMAQFASITQDVEGGTQGMLSALQAGSMGMIAQRDLMRSYNDAAALVSDQFAQRLPEAMGLLSKVALATGEDMGFMMDSLVKGVGRVSPMILDNLKIQVGVAEATARASEMFGKEADQLTKLEQQTAIMDLTLEKLTEKFGDLPDASQTASAQMARLGANFQNIKDTLGQFLLPAFAQFLEGINQLVGSFSMAISEGGAFYPILINIGAALALLGDVFSGIASTVSEWLADMQTDTSDTFFDMIDNAFEWGTDIVTSLADGITQAASTVLDIAMQAIENALSFWLAPGSPPKVAPQLKNWGVDYMGELLGGMTEADWGVLEGIQGPLKKILEGPEFAGASKAISESLVAGDRSGALDTIRKQTGAFGGELAELAQRQFELADATTAVEDAENQLEAARKQQLMSQRQVSAETAKYNELLREGASDEMLEGQLARINAAEQERDATAMVSEEQLAAAQARQASAEQGVGLQAKIVDELLAYNDALTEQEKKERAAARGVTAKGATGAPTAAGALAPRTGGIDIAGRIGAAIDAAKGELAEKFAGLFAPLRESWDTNLAKLGEKWDTFVALLGDAWTDIKTKWPGLQDLEDWIVELPAKIGTLITEGWEKLKKALRSIWTFVETYLLPIVVDLGKLGFEVLKGLVLDFLIAWSGEDGLHAKLKKVWSFIKDDLIPKIIGEEGLGPVLLWLKDKIIDPLKVGITYLVDALTAAHTWLGNLLELIRGANMKKVEALIGSSPSPLAIGIQTAADAMERMARVSLPKFNMAMAMTPAMTPSFAGAGGTTYNNQRSMSADFNTTINNGMDEATFNARVERAMRRALLGR